VAVLPSCRLRALQSPTLVRARRGLRLRLKGPLSGRASRHDYAPCPRALRTLGSFAAGLAAARRASSEVELLAALGTLELPLERGRDRLEHAKLLRFSRSPSPQVRRAAARLLGYFRFQTVKESLRSLLDDPHLDVRQEAVEALVRAGGAVHASKLLATCGSEAISYFVEMLEYESNDLVALETLERFADHPDSAVQATVRRVALVLQPDFKASESARRRLDGLATRS
jgi:HEAT repeat protein